jgi:hypothetical protein
MSRNKIQQGRLNYIYSSALALRAELEAGSPRVPQLQQMSYLDKFPVIFVRTICNDVVLIFETISFVL